MNKWRSCALGEVAEFVRGITFKPDDVVPLGTTDSVVCMRTKNVQKELDVSDVWSVDRSFVKRSNQFLKTGDILVSSANSWNLVGKCCWVPQLKWPASFGGFVSVLRARAEEVEARFLFHWFSSGRVQSTVRSFGRQTTNISNLNFGRCLELELPLPPLSEQQRITAALDHVETLRTKRRATLIHVDELAQSIFFNTFGDTTMNPMRWSKITLPEVLEIPLRNGVSPSSCGNVQCKVLTLSAITGREFRASALKLGNFKTTPPATQTVDSSDLLICRGNGNIDLVGRGCFPTIKMPDVLFPDTIIAARASTSRISRAFLQAVWNSSDVRRQIKSVARTTNGTLKVNQKALEEISFISPPLSMQQEFEKRVAAADRMRVSNHAHLAELDALFASLQYRAFRGEL